VPLSVGFIYICRCWDVFDVSSLTEILAPVAECVSTASLLPLPAAECGSSSFALIVLVSRIEMGATVTWASLVVVGWSTMD
jgi:hypothetical protein